MDILAELFSSEHLIKIMRLFLLNPEEVFDAFDISERSKVVPRKARYEINLLKKIGFIMQGVRESEIVLRSQSKKGRRARKKKIKGWQLNPLFPFLRPLKNLLLNAAPIPRDQLLRRIRGTGTIKLVVLTGFFLDSEEGSDSRIDILIVGDNIKKTKLERVMRAIEAKVGKELNYATLNSKEFTYRVGMYDKFIRDIFDYPHETIYDKIGL
ncbi:MAG: hypothetical protein COU47_01320 [Candidatus Niyogibacteria bacterium CG10_big_fil_rev_8_21_14_0_10_46_36]|uniref:Transcriptional regulator n=1 Tax=Candidatus Niyogibacteria bacterium CG10_big_fil_rev_8_21_14_0_10_46_36 TaxID=1974726 RepID=A0A2H0TDT5_9BACT|nr:MAG: hypothetical protein COU47_01320 [Candidatus Niyogibacteria bacterium CG10_big_fil_rev_8_21_14_0_10_46_36]